MHSTYPNSVDPYRGSIKNPAKYVISFDRKGGRYVLIFNALYAAKKFIDDVLQGDEYDFETPKQVITESWVTIKSDRLKEILDYQLTKAESNWVHDKAHQEYASHIRRMTQSKDKAPCQKRKDLVTLQQIAAELNIPPKKARQILRRHKVQPTDCGWAWENDEKIKKILIDNYKKKDNINISG